MEVLKKSLGIRSVDEELKIVKAVRCLSSFHTHSRTLTRSLAASLDRLLRFPSSLCMMTSELFLSLMQVFMGRQKQGLWIQDLSLAWYNRTLR